MGFAPILPRSTGHAVTVGLYSGGGNSPSRLTVTMDSSIAVRLGLKGQCVFYFGTDNDFGSILIEPVEKGLEAYAIKISESSKGARNTISTSTRNLGGGYVPTQARESGYPAKHDLDADMGTLTIVIPKHILAHIQEEA